MYQQQVYFLMIFLMFLDALIIIIGGYSSVYFNWLLLDNNWKMEGMTTAYLILFLMFVNNFVMGKLNLYSAKRMSSFMSTVQNIGLSVTVLFSFLSVALFSLKVEVISRQFILLYAVIVTLLFILERAFLEVFLDRQQRAGFNCHRILLVGSGDRIDTVIHALFSQKSWGHKVIGYIKEACDALPASGTLPLLGTIEGLQHIVIKHSIDEIVFALSPQCASIDLRQHIDMCEEIGTTYRIVPALFDPQDSKNIHAESVQGIPTLVKSTINIDPAGLLYKRFIDYAVGSIGLLFLMVMYPFIALAIKLDSSGPVLFRQMRVGQHGRTFHIYKFRTMVVDADKKLKELMAHNEMKGLMFKMKHDPRITRVGRFLRATSLDEFPQFINVIKGEMSLVGTRPPTKSEVTRYEARHRRRISIKPGLTGLWQVSGRNKIDDFEQVVKLDLHYIDNWHLWEDLRIIWRTVWVVFARKGAS